MTLLRRRGTLIEVVSWLALATAAVAAAYVAVYGVGGDTKASPPVARRATAPSPAPRQPPQRPRTPAPAAPARNLTITATRGECWLEVRAASAAGAVLYRGLLRRGRTAQFDVPAVWVTFGASQNVDVRVAGRRRRVPVGTVSLVLRTRR
jgi:hypothetical protein